MSPLKLRLLSVTDLHGAVMAHDYFSGTEDSAQGFVRTASLIRAARSEVDNTMLFDSGDYIQGSPMSDLFVGAPERLETETLPIIAAMNHMGVEASTLGNHDFNYGLAFLEATLKGADFPIVCANVVAEAKGQSPAQDKTLRAPYTILNRTFRDDSGADVTLRIGVTGVCPPQIMTWDKRLLEGRIDAHCTVEALQHWVPRMRADGVDLVVVLCHAGIDDSPKSAGMEQVAVHVAALESVDVVLAGHQHMVFPSASFAPSARVDPEAGLVSGKPLVMAAYNGARLGVVDLTLSRDADATGWQVVAHRCETRPIRDAHGAASVADDASLKAMIAPVHAETLAYVARPMAHTDRMITTYFVPVASSPALDIVAQAQAAFVAGEMAGSAYADLPLISLTAPFKAGGFGGPKYYTRIAPGGATTGDVIDLYLYPNGATALCLSTDELRDWLDRAAGMFRQVPDGAVDAPLLNDAFQTYNFDVAYGLSYQIDLSRPSMFDDTGERRPGAMSRIRSMAVHGVPVTPEQRFLVATNSFRAGGGGGFPVDGNGERVGDWPIPVRDVLMAHLAAGNRLDSAPGATWRFAPQPGTSVALPTSPRAGDDLPKLATGTPELIGQRADGFAEYRILL